jgi:hypothetical protein
LSLSRGAWRTLYNVADALDPESGEGRIRELERGFARLLADPTRARTIARVLSGLEFEARLRGAPLRGFSWLSRSERCALLSRRERSAFGFRRRALALLREGIEASPPLDQSRPGA